MDGVVAYILGKSYTKKSLIGIGALAGAPCQVQSINKVDKTTTITLKWEDNVGGVHTQSFEVLDGEDGVSVANATINSNGHLILTLSDGNDIDCGQVLPQYDTMPSPSASNVGQILQYIGTTTSNYTNGYFYECINDGGVYKWVEKPVQNSYSKSEIGDLSNLPDNTKNVVENIGILKLSINQLQSSKLSISDIDDELSDVSENPVQNKVIKLAIDQLRGSILDRIDDKEDRFRYSIMPTANDENVGKIVEYIGTTDSTYINGYFYQCRFDGTDYIWVQKNVQPNSGSGGQGVVDGYYKELDHLFYEDISYSNPISGNSDTLYVSLDTNLVYRFDSPIFVRVDEVVGENDVINGYYNITDGKFYEDNTYTTEITGETGKIYISIDTNIQYRWDDITTPHKFVTISSSIDVDDAFSTTSENPVQNKVITAKINDLDALMATKLSLADVDGALSGTSLNPVQNRVIKIALDNLNASMLSASMKQKLTNLEPVYMIGSGLNLDRDTGKLTATGISIPIDDHLDGSSINPVQNKVISLAIEQLQGSVLNRIRKRLEAQEDNFAIWDDEGEIKDSGISKNVIPLLQGSILNIKSDINTLQGSLVNKQNKLTEGNGIDIDANNEISVDIDYLTASRLGFQKKLNEGNGIDINDTTDTISLDVSYLTASRVGYIPKTEKGVANGVAELNESGKIPSSQLPSYVDDVIDGYYKEADGKFYKESTYTTEIVGEDGKIYISVDTNIQYRWTGSAFAALGGALQLGETSSTAYRGDRGKTAYDHSQITDGRNPHNTTADNVNLKVPISALSGSKLDVESTLYGLYNKSYLTDDTTETTIDDADYIPFYDTSASAKKKISWSNIKSVLKTYFDNIYATITNLNKKADLTDLAPAFDDTTTYAIGDYVTYTDGDVYRFTSAHTGAWASGDVTKVDVGAELKNKISKSSTAGLVKNDGTIDTNTYLTTTDVEDKADLTDLAPEFDDATAYTIGQYVIYDSDVYKFTTDHSAGAWVGTDATKVDIGGELLNKVSYDFNANIGVHNLYDFTKNVKEGANVAISLTDTGVRVYTTSNAAYAVSNVPISTTGMKVGNRYTLEADVTYVSGQGRMTVRDGVTIQETTGIITSSGHYSVTFTLLSNYTSISLFSTLSTVEAGDITFDNIVIKDAEDTYVGYTDYAESNIDLTKDKVSYDFNAKTGVHQLMPLTLTKIKALNVSSAYSWNDNVCTINDTDITFTVDANDYVINIQVTGTPSANSYISIFSGTLKAGSYKWSGCPVGGGDNTYATFCRTGDTTAAEFGYDTGDGGSFTITQNKTINYYIKLATASSAINLTFKPLLKYAEDFSDDYTSYAMTNIELTQIASSVPTIAPTPSSSLDEDDIVTSVNGAVNTSINAPSLYAIQRWSNSKTKRFIVDGSATGSPIGTTGIGTWDDSLTPVETDWLYIEELENITSSSNDIDVSLKFDPSSGETIILRGYIIDTTTGKMCIKFANTLDNPTNAKVAIDITYLRNEIS